MKIYTKYQSLFSISITLVLFALTAITNSYQYDSTSRYDTKFENNAWVDTISTNLSGKQLYNKACATCHGANGKGTPKDQLGLQAQPADFTKCNFASREPNGDWLAVAHQGGPTRGFSTQMPAFGEALPEKDLQKILNHIRSFCTDDNWPRGELNMPRPLLTEKAYPEDEAVFTTSIDVENEGAVNNEIVYEQRFGARNQVEIVVPFGYRQQPGGNWTGGHLGDMAVGVKRALFHNYDSGTILSLTGEVIFPTGDTGSGLGKGTTVLEPFASFGQLLPANGFFHAQTGLELPLIREAGDEAFWRAAIGKSFNPNPWGRTWSPMVEVVGSREFESGTATHWDIVPQMQVTLNTRQHIMLNIGVRIPADDPARDSQFMVYILWDWFDGGFFEGW
ncbi:c-type cytochrome [Fodinibius sp. AD559]|uniref:c-type cytochrome n=1 Tax=Fodinibius sp. AD559 TaxID=3424179 RepID=UPI004046E465